MNLKLILVLITLVAAPSLHADTLRDEYMTTCVAFAEKRDHDHAHRRDHRFHGNYQGLCSCLFDGFRPLMTDTQLRYSIALQRQRAFNDKATAQAIEKAQGQQWLDQTNQLFYLADEQVSGGCVRSTRR